MSEISKHALDAGDRSPRAPSRGGRIAGLALAIALLTLGLQLASLFRSGASSDPANSSSDSGGGRTDRGDTHAVAEAGESAWEAALARERAARQRLERKLAAVEARLANDLPPNPVAAMAVEENAAPATGSARRLDESALIAAGFSESEARELRTRYDELQMERLYLRDRAAREGWIADERWGSALAELRAREAEIASRYGEEAYDWVLYASGRPNRVTIQQVIRDSPAAQAGIEVGDILLRYADERVRDGNELRSATTAGVAGEWVVIEILRDGRNERIRVPRGPIGVTVGADSVAPNAG